MASYPNLASSEAASQSEPISVSERDGVRVVSLRGEHDLSTAKQIALACAPGSLQVPVVADLTAATFIDSAAIGQLITASEHAPAGWFVVAVRAGSEPARIIAMVLADAVMPVVDDLERAVDLAAAAGARTS